MFAATPNKGEAPPLVGGKKHPPPPGGRKSPLPPRESDLN